LGDLVLDSDEQKNLSSPPKQNGLAGTTSGNASHADPKTSLANLKTGSESQPAKADNILLYSVMQGSPESKARETKPQTKISLKKLTINSGSGSSASNKVIGPIVDKDKSSVQGDELAYSFLCNSKFRGDNQGQTVANYDQIYGGGREEGDANTQELSISPTKVRRTPLSHVRTSQRSSHYSEYLTSLRQVGSKDYMQTGCFNILKIKTALQLKKVTEGSLDHENCKPGLVSLDELLVSRLQKEVSGLFKHGYMIEAPLSNLQNDGSLNVSLLKSAVICGLNSIPVDLAALSTDDKALYNSLFEVLPNACPGFRRSNGVVCIKRCKDHFRHLKTNLQSITKCCIRVHAAIKMGHFFFKHENNPPGSSSPKKGKLVPNYSKLEIRISEWFNHSWSTRLHVNCEYDPLQELNYYFEDDQIAEIVERPSEMKRVKLEIWGYGGSSSNDSKLLEEKTILPALCLPGYRTIYFGPDNSSHLVVHFTINPIQTSS
jgi:hypothetical protein